MKINSKKMGYVLLFSLLLGGISTGSGVLVKADDSADAVLDPINTNKEEQLLETNNAEDIINFYKNSITEDDMKYVVGKDGTGDHDEGEMKEEIEARSMRASYPNVNNYINQKKFPNPKIYQDSRQSRLPKYSFKNGKPIGVVVHETANPNSTIDGEVNYMYNNWGNAFVHGYVNRDKVIQTANLNYLSWGAGAYANPYFMQVELVREHSFDNFARSVNNDAYLMAYWLKSKGLKPSYGDSNGNGSVISHSGISRFWGGTDHNDPVAYFNSWGYNMSQYYALVNQKYNELNGQKPTTPTTPPNNKITGTTYKVVKGDTLYSISQRSGKSIDNIKKWNNLKNNTLEIGQVLRLTAPTTSTGVTVKSEVALKQSKWMTINKDVDYGNKAEGLSGRVVKGNTKNLKGKNVEVIKEAELSNGTKHSYIVQNSRKTDLGWVRSDALVKTPVKSSVTLKEHKKGTQVKDVWMTINGNTPIYNEALGLSGSKEIGNTSSIKLKDVKVTEEKVLSNGKTYSYITQNSEKNKIGWIEKTKLTKKQSITVKEHRKGNKVKGVWMKINSNTDIFSDAEGLSGAKKTGNTSTLKYKDVKVTEEKVLSNGKTYSYITQNSEKNKIGWVESSKLVKK